MIEIESITECLEAHKKGVRFELPTVGVFYLRRGGLSEWQKAVREATEEILSREYSFNEVDPRQLEEINALACVNYLVASFEDVKDVDGQEVPYSITNAKNLFLPKENYELVNILIKASTRADLFLAANVRMEAERLKKCLEAS